MPAPKSSGNQSCRTDNPPSNCEASATLVEPKINMEKLYFVLSFLGSVASIITGIVYAKQYKRWLISAVILLLGIVSAVALYQYNQLTDARRIAQEQRTQAQKDAAELLRNIPTSPVYFSPGENRGVAFAGLALLEQHQRQYPLLYSSLAQTLQRDIVFASSHPDSSDERHTLEVAAGTVIQMLRGIAGDQSRKY